MHREGREERKREDLQAKCADRTICFHVIYQETQLCGRNPKERVNHVHLVVVCCVICRMLYCYCIFEIDLRYNLRISCKCGKE